MATKFLVVEHHQMGIEYFWLPNFWGVVNFGVPLI
jgi:hypothetical protein